MAVETAEAEVLAVLERADAALRDKDLDALGDCYSAEARIFDVGSQMAGYEELRGVWESCLSYFPNPIETHRKDFQLVVGPEVAVATYYSRLTGMETDHPAAKSWLRTTVCLRRIDGDWKIIHDHSSYPVDCMAEKPSYLFDLD